MCLRSQQGMCQWRDLRQATRSHTNALRHTNMLIGVHTYVYIPTHTHTHTEPHTHMPTHVHTYAQAGFP